MFERDIAHRRSVAVLCMLYKIRCNQIQPLYGALPVSYVLVRVTRCALVAHRNTYALPCCRTSRYRTTFIALSHCGMILQTLYSMVSNWRVWRAGPMLFQRPKLLYPFFFSTIFPRLFFLSICFLLWGCFFLLIECRSLSPSRVLPPYLIVIKYIHKFYKVFILYTLVIIATAYQLNKRNQGW